eukprot:TRINITY_DN102638_c0_g1_i1.p1 TRINITY_DN102638_c0_g1~~TRINITY_DN102638_c0_g1_i1.p1  ORF type:complete len:231 (+),score=64.06 TRINITY_DN102638_c0_g1_i1:86-778(+)
MFLDKGSKKVGGKVAFGGKAAWLDDKATKKVVGDGRKTPLLAGLTLSRDDPFSKSSKEARMGKGKDKELGVDKDKDKDKDKLKKGKKNPKWGKTDGKTMSRSVRAGVQFPVGRVHRLMKQYVTQKGRIAGTAGVYVAAVMEYLSAEVMELAGNAAIEGKNKRITPRHLQLAIRGDDELDALIKATIAGGGVVPHIAKELLPQKKAKTSSGASSSRALPDSANGAMVPASY